MLICSQSGTSSRSKDWANTTRTVKWSARYSTGSINTTQLRYNSTNSLSKWRQQLAIWPTTIGSKEQMSFIRCPRTIANWSTSHRKRRTTHHLSECWIGKPLWTTKGRRKECMLRVQDRLFIFPTASPIGVSTTSPRLTETVNLIKMPNQITMSPISRTSLMKSTITYINSTNSWYRQFGSRANKKPLPVINRLMALELKCSSYLGISIKTSWGRHRMKMDPSPSWRLKRAWHRYL